MAWKIIAIVLFLILAGGVIFTILREGASASRIGDLEITKARLEQIRDELEARNTESIATVDRLSKRLSESQATIGRIQELLSGGEAVSGEMDDTIRRLESLCNQIGN